jgi:tRNA threonylcarbamoyladenosine biosynthesis protein TsaE
VLIQEYEARLPIYHFDAYRLREEEDFRDLGVEEYFAGRGVCLVEWADRVRRILPAEYLQLSLRVTGENTRGAELRALGSRYASLLTALTQAAPAATTGK